MIKPKGISAKLIPGFCSNAYQPRLWAFLSTILIIPGCSSSPLGPVSPAFIGPDSGDIKFAQALEKIRLKERLPALASAIVVGGKTRSIAAVGTRLQGTDNWVKKSDRFLIGSCAKAFTATLAGILVDQDLLTWETTIKDVFPRMKMLPDYGGITIGQLLSHRAGFPKNLGEGQSAWAIDYGFDDKRGSLPESLRRQYVEKIVQRPLKYPPGKTVHYSNAGYIVAGAMLERVSGKSFESLRQERLFQPLEITTAAYGTPPIAERMRQPWGHYWDKSKQAFAKLEGKPPKFLAPAGYLSISLEDWIKFVLAHLDVYPVGHQRLVSANTLNTIHSPPPMETWDINIGFDTNYALGWFTNKTNDDHLLIWHGGRGLAFNAVMVADLTSRNAILLVTNADVPHIHPQYHLLQMVKEIQEYYQTVAPLPGIL
ncbi:MAG: beta-lactamase family protein [Gammaproteobacteria bacterium]|nr:beta-lactamase family protein [Gammaproteobacteria bacterium]MDH3537343.1 beta-lactamase family protein [Gammaproteobacteria bacterium]